MCNAKEIIVKMIFFFGQKALKVYISILIACVVHTEW